MISEIIVNGTAMYVEFGHSWKECMSKFGNIDGLWDFPIEELLDGTIEPNSEILYWFVDGRLYETDIPSKYNE